MEQQLAPSVVRPPCASRMAWKMRTMRPRTLVAVGPKSMAPSPVPVMCELDPVTLGILSEEMTNTKAPARASSVRARRFSERTFLMDWKPTTTNGRLTTPHAMQYCTGRKPSMICMACAAGMTPNIAVRNALAPTSAFLPLDRYMQAPYDLTPGLSRGVSESIEAVEISKKILKRAPSYNFLSFP